MADDDASEKKPLIGEIELNGVESFTVINPVEFGHAAGKGVKFSWAVLSSCANAAMAGATSFVMVFSFSVI